MDIPILNYHDISQKFRVGITRVSPSAFWNQMEWISDSGYQSVRLSEIPSLADRGQKLFAVTFDDAYCDLQTTAFPVLCRLGFNAALVVIAGYVGRTNDWEARLGSPRLHHLDWRQIREWINAGHEVASHGYSHRSLIGLSSEALNHEIGDSKSEIEDRLGIEIQSFVPPFGRINNRIAESVANCGYRRMCLNTPVPISVPNLTVMVRRGIHRFDTLASFQRKVLLGWNSTANVMGWKFQHFCSSGTILAQRWFLKENIP